MGGEVEGKLGLARLQAWASSRLHVTARRLLVVGRGRCWSVLLLAMLDPEGEAWMQGRVHGEDAWATRIWRAHVGLWVRMRRVTGSSDRGKNMTWRKKKVVGRYSSLLKKSPFL